MATATKTTNETTNNDDQAAADAHAAKVTALVNLRTAAMVAGLSMDQIAELVGPDMGLVLDEARKRVVEAIGTHTVGLDTTMHEHADRALLNGDTFVVVVRFTDEGTTVERRYVAPPVPTKKNAKKGTKSASVSTGNVLIVNQTAFKDFATLNRHLGIYEPKNSPVRTYGSATEKDSTKYPAPALVSYEEFFADGAAKKIAPKGYYETDRATKTAKKVEAVR